MQGSAEGLAAKDGVRHALTVPLAIYFAAFAVLTWPLILSFPSHFFLDQGDGMQNVWNIWWMRQSLAELRSPYFTDALFHPDGVTLIGQTLNPFNGCLGIAIGWFMTDIAMVNTIVVFSFVATGVTTFWLARYFAPTAYWSSMLTGGLFTFSSYHFGHAAGHMQLISLEFLPLFLLFWLRLLDAPSKTRGAVTALTLGLVLACDHYYTFYCVISGAVLLAGHCIGRRSVRHLLRAPYLWSLATFVVISAALVLPLFIALMRANAEDEFLGSHDAASSGLDLFGLFLPSGDWCLSDWTAWFWRDSLPVDPSESATYLRYTLLFAAAFAAVQWRRGRLTQRFFGTWCLLAALFFVLALGPVLHVAGESYDAMMPYRALATIVPQLELSGMPIRMNVMVLLAICVVAIPAWPLLWRSSVPMARVLFAALLLFETWPRPLTKTALVIPDWVTALADLPEGCLAGSVGGPVELYYQTVHGKPLLHGYISRLPLSRGKRLDQFEHLIESGQYRFLMERYKARYMLVSKFDSHRRLDAHEPVPGLKPVFIGRHHDLLALLEDPLPALPVPPRDCGSGTPIAVHIDSNDAGQPIALQISAPNDGGRHYRLALSLGTSPPVSIARHPIPLKNDFLFRSTSNPENPFVSNQTGRFDEWGRATVQLRLDSPDARGMRLYYCVVVFQESEKDGPGNLCRIGKGGSFEVPR